MVMIVSLVSNAQNECPKLTTSTSNNGVKVTSVDYETSPQSQFIRCSFQVAHGEFDGYGSYITSDSSFTLVTDDSERFFFMKGDYFDTAKEYEVILRDFTAPNKSTTICIAKDAEAKRIIEQTR